MQPNHDTTAIHSPASHHDSCYQTPRNTAHDTYDHHVALFGLKTWDATLVEAADWIVSRASRRQSARVSFLNADCVNIMHRHPAYQDALKMSDRIFLDGIGVRLAARLHGHALRDNVNGTDLFPILCQRAAAAEVGIYLFGAKPGRAAASATAMQGSIAGLKICGAQHGYIQGATEEARVIRQINESGAEILLVALGAPAQELWIARNRHRLNPSVILGVGGLFDYYSGSIPRAPSAFRRFGMEWVWRLAMEPRRLARRYIVGNAEFLLRVARHALHPAT